MKGYQLNLQFVRTQEYNSLVSASIFDGVRPGYKLNLLMDENDKSVLVNKKYVSVNSKYVSCVVQYIC